MHKSGEEKNPFWKNRKIKELLILLAFAAVLTYAAWKAFYPKAEDGIQTGAYRSQSEQALGALLAEIDGVGDVDVMIYEGETGEKKVVIVCDGANDIRVNAAVCEAAAAAVGTKETNVKVYQKKNK